MHDHHHNGKYHCHMAASCTYHYHPPTIRSPNCPTRAIQKSLTLNEKYLRVFWREKKKSGEQTITHQQKNYKTERARGLGRNNKRGDRKGESNDSPEIPGKRPTSDIMICQLPLRFFFSMTTLERLCHCQQNTCSSFVLNIKVEYQWLRNKFLSMKRKRMS